MSSSLRPPSAASRIWAPLELAGGMLAAADEPREFSTLGFSQLDVVAYVHAGLLANRIAVAQPNHTMNQLFGTCPQRSPTSRASTWPSFTPTAASSAARPRKPTCSGTSRSRPPVSTKWCSHSNAPASSDGPQEQPEASNSSSSRSTYQSSAELQTVKTSVQRN